MLLRHDSRTNMGIKLINAHYDSARRLYWIQNTRKGWIEISETSMRRHLQEEGRSDKCKANQPISSLDRRLNQRSLKG
jgi:hypothetical protein